MRIRNLAFNQYLMKENEVNFTKAFMVFYQISHMGSSLNLLLARQFKQAMPDDAESIHIDKI